METGPDDPGGALVAASHQRTVRTDLVWRYAPVWDFKSMSLVRFRLTSGDRGRTEGDGKESVGFDIDVRAVSKAIDDLSRLVAEERRLSVVCTLHESSLGVRWRRDQLVQLLSEAPAAVRRLLSFEVLAAEFAPTNAIREFARATQPLAIRCGLCVPLGEMRAEHVAALPLSFAAVEVRGRLSQAETLSALNAFAAQCARLKRDAWAHTLDARPLVIGAIAAGVRFLSGNAVHPDIDDLRMGLRFEPADLYRDLLIGRPA